MHNRLISNLSSLSLYSDEKGTFVPFQAFLKVRNLHFDITFIWYCVRNFSVEILALVNQEISDFDVCRRCTGQLDFSSHTTCGDLRFLRANVSKHFVGLVFMFSMFKLPLYFMGSVEVKCVSRIMLRLQRGFGHCTKNIHQRKLDKYKYYNLDYKMLVISQQPRKKQRRKPSRISLREARDVLFNLSLLIIQSHGQFFRWKQYLLQLKQPRFKEL